MPKLFRETGFSVGPRRIFYTVQRLISFLCTLLVVKQIQNQDQCPTEEETTFKLTHIK